MPIPSNRRGQARLFSRRVGALGTPADHDHVGPKLLIHVESLIRFVQGFATSGLNSSTMIDRGERKLRRLGIDVCRCDIVPILWLGFNFHLSNHARKSIDLLTSIQLLTQQAAVWSCYRGRCTAGDEEFSKRLSGRAHHIADQFEDRVDDTEGSRRNNVELIGSL